MGSKAIKPMTFNLTKLDMDDIGNLVETPVQVRATAEPMDDGEQPTSVVKDGAPITLNLQKAKPEYDFVVFEVGGERFEVPGSQVQITYEED